MNLRHFFSFFFFQGGERDERQIETPDNDEWDAMPDAMLDGSEWGGDPYGDDDAFDDTTSIVTMSDILHQRFDRNIRLDRREQQLKDKERELEIREKVINNGIEKILKKKVDEWLAKPREQRNVIIDHEIIGFAMNQHPYLWMKPEDRRRVNSVRYELEKMEEIAHRNANREYCCPICFDSIQTNRPFSAPECGHMHCDDCIKEMVRIAGPGNSARCTKCLMDINMANVRRIFFAGRE